MIIKLNTKKSNRRGAAVIIALVLLLLVGALSTSLIRGFYTDRRERDQSFIREQAELLQHDFVERTQIQRNASPDFAGETLALTGLSGSFDGTFQLTSTFAETPEGTVEPVVVVDYYDAANKLTYTCRSEIAQ